MRNLSRVRAASHKKELISLEKQKKHEELLNELNACREDERNSQNQIIQIISTAATALGIFLGASSLGSDENSSVPVFAIFILSNIIFFIAFTYIMSCGIINTLRYHYIQDLEDQIAKLHTSPTNCEYVSWMSFQSPITTKNPRHICSFHTLIHYICFHAAVLLILLFCCALILFQHKNCTSPQADIVLNISIVLTFITLFVYLYACLSSKSMYDFARRTSLARKQSRLSNSHFSHKESRKAIFSILLYFIYPKIRDLQKPLLIVIGFIIGALLCGISSINELNELFPNLLLVLFIFEYLAYQARYQINDIRGIHEDMAAKKLGRLPVDALGGVQHAVLLSLFIACLRIVAIIYMVSTLEEELRFPTIVLLILFTIVSFLYEFARGLTERVEKHEKWADILVILLVGFGYPFRIAVGMMAAYPTAWTNTLSLAKSWNVIFLLLSFYFMGIYSVLLAWKQESIKLNQTGVSKIKAIYHRLYQSINANQAHPLREPRQTRSFWNISYFISMASLSTTLYVTYPLQEVLVGEVLLAILTFLVFISWEQRIIVSTIASSLFVLEKCAFAV